MVSRKPSKVYPRRPRPRVVTTREGRVMHRALPLLTLAAPLVQHQPTWAGLYAAGILALALYELRAGTPPQGRA